MLTRKSLTSATCHQSNCDDRSTCVMFICRQAGKELFDIPKSLPFPLWHGVLFQAVLFPCQSFVLFNECVNFLLVGFSYGTFWLTTAWVIDTVRISILHVFHPPSDTAGTHPGTSIHKKNWMKSPVDVCSLTVLLHKEFNHCMLVK
jgi:hypothetical protein